MILLVGRRGSVIMVRCIAVAGRPDMRIFLSMIVKAGLSYSAWREVSRVR